ncbi:MAG: hypothetical protein ABI645_17955 [Pseudomonadota bacterium]
MARTSSPKRESAEEFSSLPIYLTPIIVQPETPRTLRASESVRRAQRRSAETTAITVAEPLPDTDLAIPLPRVDWAQEVVTTVEAVTRSKREPRKFGALQKKESLPDEESARPLIQPPAHRAGEIEVLGPGIERRWLSENCFMEFGHPLLELFPAPGPKVNPVRCRMGSAVDGHIFDHLKPEYLKQK